MPSKELWMENILDSLKEIASEEFQKKGWIEGKVHEYCRFAGTIAGLYEDAHFDMFIDEKAEEFGLTKNQIKKLDNLRRALNKYIKKNGCYEEPDKIISDPRWHAIMKMAQEALLALGIEKYLEPSKEIARRSLLYRIWWITDQKTLEKIWTNKIKPDENSLEYLLDSFFETCKAQQLIENYKEYEITEEQRERLVKLYDALDMYKKKIGENPGLQELLKDPEWNSIQKLAEDVLKAFAFQMYS